MSIFKGQREKAARQEVEYAMSSIPEPDGRIHVMLIRSYGQLLNDSFGADNKYNEQINEVLNALQDKGMEIVRVETNTIFSQQIGAQCRYDTLITYR